MNLQSHYVATGTARMSANMKCAANLSACRFPHVRLATPADVPQLIELGRMLHAENALMPLSENRISEAVWRAVKQDHAVLGVIGKTGAIEGGIYLTIGRFWYTDDLHLEELFSYVRPECRRSENAKALIEFAKSSAVRLKVPLLIGIISNDRTEAKARLYERQLGKRAGAWFLYNAKTGSKG
jgi:hypothetical protein